MSVDHLQGLCRCGLLNQRFSTACSDTIVKDLKSLHLQTLGYQRVSSRKKITILVADLQSRQLQFNVSARVEGNEGFDEKIMITRVRNQPKGHGFVTFYREESTMTDFRIGITTYETNLHPDKEMVEWIEKA
ncbi:hypothetical protein SUGI_1196520 [Cryptomeria japonica]|nr:hypothetical protein SUGI_1196520 [Cryptomeria japonica]